MTGKWGKAGERRDPVARDTRRRELVAERNRLAPHRREQTEQARKKWAAGMLVPHNITVALDIMGLEGPDVDVACKAAEPDVDLWEAGALYPSWEQLGALAELTQKPVWWFVERHLHPTWTSLRFHIPDHKDDPPPVWVFTEQALRDHHARTAANGEPGD